MKISRESIIHNQSPEYRSALQELIKFELQALVERLSATGEEALVLTASCQDGTSMQFGSQKAEGFLRKQLNLGDAFLTFCNDETTQSSADELCNYGDEDAEADQKDEEEEVLQKQTSSQLQFSPHRQRERTTSKRISFTEELPKDNDEGSQNSNLSESERNDSASSVASFVEAQEKSKTSKSNLDCKICSRHFRSYKTLNVHMRLHMAKSYKCAVCGKIFTMKKSYQRHIESHKRQNMGKLFECGICDKSYADLNAWKRHREIHLEVRNYSCNLCGKAFVEKYSLRVHQTSHFYPAVKNERNADISSGYSCHICGKLSKTKTAMKKHMLTHSAKKFTCEFCNKRFSVKYSYVRHRRIHTGEKPYKCGFCERSFSDSSAWAKHVRTHTGGKQYSCDLCSKSFYDKTLCKTHMKRHQRTETFKIPPGGKTEKRNFEIVTSKIDEEFDNPKRENDSPDFQKAGTSSTIYNEDLNLRLDVSDKESEDSRLLDSGFGTELLPAQDENITVRRDKSPEKKYTSIIESIGLDEKFQTDFVERNMPAKPLESDSEFISTSFPDDADILAEETETDTQPSDHSKYSIRSPQKPDPGSSPAKYGSTERRSYQRRANVGKLIPDSPAKCKKCNKKFQQESMLKQHLQFHCMMKLYKCRYCGKQLTTKQSLIRHERIHIGDRPYQCHLCRKTFADNYGCIRHINTHFNKESRNSTASSTVGSVKPLVKQMYGDQSYMSHTEQDLKFDGSSNASQSFTHSVDEKYKRGQRETKVDPSKASVNETNKPVRAGNESMCKNGPESQKTESKANSTNNNTSAVNNEGKKHLYKCFRCPALFPSQQLCLEHIQQQCANQKPEEQKNISLPTYEKLNNLFQCMLCMKMFSSKDICQKHVVDCQQSKVSTDCAIQSLLQESLLDVDLSESTETLPSLPFPDVNTEPGYLDDQDNEDILLSINNVTRSSADETQTSENITQSAQIMNQTGSCVSSTQNNTQSTLIVTQSTRNSTQCNVASTQSAIQVSQPVINLAQSALNMSKATPCQAVASSTETGVSGVNSLQKQNTLLFIPLRQMSGQGSTGICLQSSNQSPVSLPTSNQTFTGIQQKPVVNIGTNKFVLTSHSIGLVGNPCVPNVQNTKSGKSKKLKNSESDISERTCSICSKVFTTKHILKQHTLIHMERNFGCKYCMKKFHNKYGRDRHERIHTGEKPFSCPTCKKAFADNSSYRNHTWKCCSAK